MAETLAQYFVDFFQNKIPNELIVFIVSLFPILELRGGMIVAKLLNVPFVTAFIISFVGNMVPIPFILLFIKKIFAWLRRFPRWAKIIDKLEARSMSKSDKIRLRNIRNGDFCFLWRFLFPELGDGQAL